LLVASGNPMLAGLADVVVEVLAGRTRHRLMPNVAEPEAIRLHGVVASAVQSRDGAAAEEAMRAIVAESAVAVQAMQGTGDAHSNGAMKDVLPSVLSGRPDPRG
jgi:DNA-binding FadR family transcriptional regulator